MTIVMNQCARCWQWVNPATHVCMTSSGRIDTPPERALREIIATLGPVAPTCEGCSAEVAEALRIARAAVHA